MGNIAEGFERSGTKEFMHALSMARGSAGELRSHVHAALDSGYITHSQHGVLSERAEEVSKIIAGLRASLARKFRNTNAARDERTNPSRTDL